MSPSAFTCKEQADAPIGRWREDGGGMAARVNASTRLLGLLSFFRSPSESVARRASARSDRHESAWGRLLRALPHQPTATTHILAPVLRSVMHAI
jgi:hypothetical protein